MGRWEDHGRRLQSRVCVQAPGPGPGGSHENIDLSPEGVKMLFLRGGQPIIIPTTVSKFKLILFVTQQVNKLRDEILGQGTYLESCWDFIWKASRPRRWSTGILKNHLTQVRILATFILKGGGVAGCYILFGAGILCSSSCPSGFDHIVPINLQQDKGYSLFGNSLSV